MKNLLQLLKSGKNWTPMEKQMPKEINVHGYTFEESADSDCITLQLRKGFWGFPIIDYEQIKLKNK